MKRDILNPKIIVIDNKKPIREAVDFVFENNLYQNHLQYWDDYFKNKNYTYDVYNSNRNMIGINLCLEGKIVFIDISKDYSDYKNGIIFLPDDVKISREKLIYLLTAKYDYLDVLYNIEYDNGAFKSEQRSIVRERKDKKQKVYRL